MAAPSRKRASAEGSAVAPVSKSSRKAPLKAATKPSRSSSAAPTPPKVSAKAPVKAPPKVAPKASAQAAPTAAKPRPGARPSVASGAAAAMAAAGFPEALSSAVPVESVQQVTEAVEALGQGMGEVLKGISGLTVPSDTLGQIQQDYVTQASQLWNQALEQPEGIELKDKRFASPSWKSNPGSAFMASMYLLNANTLKRLADNLQGDLRSREKIRFAVSQWVDAASPSNFLAFNPEAQKLAMDTQGESLSNGVQHLLHDIRQGHMSQTDESLFEVGRNVATTEGTVVYENPYFQLIEYKPLTEKVHAVPFLFVPPCINKYYILDLQPANSLVRYQVSQGHRVFMISWVNADDSLAQATWDDYVEQGVFKAIDVVKDISGVDQINALGFCIGGTLLASALAVLEARGERPVASLTLLTAFLDFVNTGPMDVFVDEPMVRMREMSLGAQSPQGGGLMKGSELATTFSFLRANDLVWNYVVGNYLKGQSPPAFDLLYWNSDSTNLPGPMYCWYLRNTYLENKLKEPGAVSVCGTPLDFRRIDVPTFIYGSREDHIVPWDSAYASTKLISGPKTFVLGASGHIAGVINPPEHKKRSFWQTPKGSKALPETASQWFDGAQEQPGSWWPTWAAWLEEYSGGWVKAPAKPGSRDYPAIEAAPGRYVKRRA
jgi:polyhydroxyalkanoate synthase